MHSVEKDILNRTARLVGDSTMDYIASRRVILFGVGGVGSWCAEGLVRSGIRHLTIVDSDRVSITNVNRQAMATTSTVGRVKVETLRERLLDINPAADIVSLQEIYSKETAALFHIEEYHYVIDAIDSIRHKLELIVNATAIAKQRKQEASSESEPFTFLSAMGAAQKMDPTQVRVSEFWDINGCPLARTLRKQMKRFERYPASKFQCVWSPELLPNRGTVASEVTEPFMSTPTEGRSELATHDWSSSKAQINGSMAHITAIFGFTLAGLILQSCYQKGV